MKPFNYILVLIAWFFLPQSVKCQNFIDILVTDTIFVKAKEIHYTVKVSSALSEELYDEDERSYKPSEYNKKLKAVIEQKEKDLLQFFKTNGIAYTISPDATTAFVINANINNQGNNYVIKLRNREELVKTYALLKQLDYIDSYISNYEYDYQEKQEITLFEKNYKKAFDKVNKFAAITNVKVGKLLQIEEIENQQIFAPFLIPGWHTYVSEITGQMADMNNLETFYDKKYRFRFELIN